MPTYYLLVWEAAASFPQHSVCMSLLEKECIRSSQRNAVMPEWLERNQSVAFCVIHLKTTHFSLYTKHLWGQVSCTIAGPTCSLLYRVCESSESRLFRTIPESRSESNPKLHTTYLSTWPGSVIHDLRLPYCILCTVFFYTCSYTCLTLHHSADLCCAAC